LGTITVAPASTAARRVRSTSSTRKYELSDDISTPGGRCINPPPGSLPVWIKVYSGPIGWNFQSNTF